MTARIGCPCGHLDEPCISESPAPKQRACWTCAGFGIEDLRNGIAAREHAHRHREAA